MEIISVQDHAKMLDELMSGNTSDVRKAKILSDLLNNSENTHKVLQQKDEDYSKLDEESKKLVDVNRKMMSEVFSGNGSYSFGSPKEKSFSETVTIEGFERTLK